MVRLYEISAYEFSWIFRVLFKSSRSTEVLHLVAEVSHFILHVSKALDLYQHRVARTRMHVRHPRIGRRRPA